MRGSFGRGRGGAGGIRGIRDRREGWMVLRNFDRHNQFYQQLIIHSIFIINSLFISLFLFNFDYSLECKIICYFLIFDVD